MEREYTILEVNGYRCVLTDCPRPTGSEQANFEGTGKALMGILSEKETLKSFLKKRERMKPIIEKSVEEFMRTKKHI